MVETTQPVAHGPEGEAVAKSGRAAWRCGSRMPSALSRRARGLVAFLLAGGVANVAVTWGWASLLPYGDPRVFSSFDAYRPWHVFRYERFGFTRIESTWIGYWDDTNWQPRAIRTRLPSWAFTHAPISDIGAWYETEQVDYAFGWPRLAMRGWLVVQTRDDDTLVEISRSGIPLLPAGSNRGSRSLPVRPMWPGFAINTMWYALLAALLWVVLLRVSRSLRHVLRQRRGVCTACAYNLRGDYSQGCPECGWGKELHPIHPSPPHLPRPGR